MPMAAVLGLIAGVIVFAMFRIAAGGEALHHQYAHRAASVDGEMIDVIGNMPVVQTVEAMPVALPGSIGK